MTLPADATVRNVMQAMRDKYGVRLERAILTSDGRVQPHARIYLGNTDVDDLAGLDTPVRGTNEMVLVSLPPGAAPILRRIRGLAAAAAHDPPERGRVALGFPIGRGFAGRRRLPRFVAR